MKIFRKKIAMLLMMTTLIFSSPLMVYGTNSSDDLRETLYILSATSGIISLFPGYYALKLLRPTLVKKSIFRWSIELRPDTGSCPIIGWPLALTSVGFLGASALMYILARQC